MSYGSIASRSTSIDDIVELDPRSENIRPQPSTLSGEKFAISRYPIKALQNEAAACVSIIFAFCSLLVMSISRLRRKPPSRNTPKSSKNQGDLSKYGLFARSVCNIAEASIFVRLAIFEELSYRNCCIVYPICLISLFTYPGFISRVSLWCLATRFGDYH